jgi:hypothetical protein
MTTASNLKGNLLAAINDATGRYLACHVDCTKYKAGRFVLVEHFGTNICGRFGRPETYTAADEFREPISLTPKMTDAAMVKHLGALLVGHAMLSALVPPAHTALGNIDLDASTPEALEETVASMRLWMIENGVACTTFLPHELNGFTAAGAADIAWDAAEKALDHTTFQCMIMFNDEPGVLHERTMSLVPCVTDDDGEPIDDDADCEIFFYFDGTQSEAEICAAYSKGNSGEDWYIV